MPKTKPPEKLRPFIFHGVDLWWGKQDEEAVGTCPFCGRELKFCVSIVTGQWDCKVCGDSGNVYTFLRKLWDESDASTTNYENIMEDRGVQFPDTLMKWGIVSSFMDHTTLVPGYGKTKDGKVKLMQLYRYVKMGDGMRLLPTPTLGHKLHGWNLYDKDKPIVYLCEGPWDGVCIWELLQRAKIDDLTGDFSQTANPDVSLGAGVNVLAVPGASVFDQSWVPLFAGKHVRLSYDSDHERENPETGKLVPPAGLTGMKRVAEILSGAKEPPTEILYVDWSKLTKELKHGYDVRDHLECRR